MQLVVIAALGIYSFFFLVYYALSKSSRSKISMVVHGSLCNGCGNCIVVCPPNAERSANVGGGKGPLNGEVIMKVSRGIVTELSMDACYRSKNGRSELCMLCINACPLGAIEFTH